MPWKPPKNMTQRREIYRKSMLSHGFLTLCYLIDYFVEQEEYEECQAIKETIEEVNAELGINYPTTFDEVAFQYCKENALMVGSSQEFDPLKGIKEKAQSVLKKVS